MTEQNKDMTTPFTEVVTNKIKKQDEQIAAMQEKIKSIPDASQDFIEVKKQLKDINVAITAIKFPARQMDELSGKLKASVALLKQPVENKVLHHHYIPKLIWVSAVLFVVLCLAFCGWYNTGQKFDQYRANDLKYRYLKMNRSLALQQLLFITDSLYQAEPDFGKVVLQGEDSVQNLIQRQVDAKEHEVNDLKRKLK
jgi:hypothetical protein